MSAKVSHSHSPTLPSSKLSIHPALVLHHAKQPELAWKAAKDVATGRTYYINSITGLTTWRMPLELLKQVRPDALNSLSTPELARWTRMSVSLPPITPPPPPPTSPPPPSPPPSSERLSASSPPSRSPPPPPMGERNSINISPPPPPTGEINSINKSQPPPSMEEPSITKPPAEERHSSPSSSSRNLSPRPTAPKRDAPRRSPSQPVQLETHRFVPDPEPSEGKVFKRPAPRRGASQPLILDTERFSADTPSSASPLSLLPEDLTESEDDFPRSLSAPPSPLPPSPQPDLPDGWLMMRNKNGREYKFKPSTGEMVWVREEKEQAPEEDVQMPPPPPLEEAEEAEEPIPLPPTNHKKTTSEPLKKYDVPMITKPKAESMCKPDAHVPVVPKHVPKEMSKFIEEVMRPKYGQGQLLKDPELLKSFFVYLINIPENLRHVVFHEFFLGIFWREEILEQLLQFGSWKQWLLILIAEAAMTQHENLEYVLMTLVEMFYYFFRKFSPSHNGIRHVHESKHLILDFASQTANRTMGDFLRDALAEIDKQSDKLVSFKVLSGVNLRICFWDRKPKWMRPDFTAVEWPNLMASLEAQEEYLFFSGPKGEFCMPKGGVEFLGLPVLESIVVLLEKLKVYHLAECEERCTELQQLQKLYSVKAIQEYEFFRTVRDFFRFHGEIDCMELQKTGFQLKAKVPPRCSASEVEKCFSNRKRSYGSKAHSKVSVYLAQVTDYYRKVFSGENAIPTKVAERPRGPPVNVER